MERNTYGYFSPVGSNHELEDVSIHSRTPLHYYNAAPVNNPITRTPSPYEPYYRPHTRKYHTPSYYAGYLWNKVILLNFKIRLPKRAFGMKVGKKHWNIGLLVGLYASLAVLITNIALLVYSIVRHLGYDGGVSTIFIGDAGAATRTSTALHVAINALSTVLLTASNYAMQLLCAPTRKELDRAHRSGKWLEIGLMSIYNLRHIDKSRAILWILLATSSLPLHLL